jgi:hypothetical protein
MNFRLLIILILLIPLYLVDTKAKINTTAILIIEDDIELDDIRTTQPDLFGGWDFEAMSQTWMFAETTTIRSVYWCFERVGNPKGEFYISIANTNWCDSGLCGDPALKLMTINVSLMAGDISDFTKIELPSPLILTGGISYGFTFNHTTPEADSQFDYWQLLYIRDDGLGDSDNEVTDVYYRKWLDSGGSYGSIKAIDYPMKIEYDLPPEPLPASPQPKNQFKGLGNSAFMIAGLGLAVITLFLPLWLIQMLVIKLGWENSDIVKPLFIFNKKDRKK